MSEFHVGDIVECVDFNGATGKLLKQTGHTLFTVRAVYKDSSDRELLRLDQDTRNGAYASRFQHAHTKMVAPEMELDEIHAAEELMK